METFNKTKMIKQTITCICIAIVVTVIKLASMLETYIKDSIEGFMFVGMIVFGIVAFITIKWCEIMNKLDESE